MYASSRKVDHKPVRDVVKSHFDLCTSSSIVDVSFVDSLMLLWPTCIFMLNGSIDYANRQLNSPLNEVSYHCIISTLIALLTTNTNISAQYMHTCILYMHNASIA